MKLSGKTALVTGAAVRIGREIARVLASRGVSIVIHCRRSVKEADDLKRIIESMGVSAWVVKADFGARGKSMESKIRSFVRRVRKTAGAVDILVNNASVFFPTEFKKISDETWDLFQEVNLKAPFFLAKEFGVEMFRRKYGKIINLADWNFFRAPAVFIPYAVSKAGLVAATAGLAKNLAPYVQVNAIAPGPILPAKGMTKAREKAVIGKTLLKRYGRPEDIAQTVRFLCEDTDFITGAVIPVDGGASVY